jgi:hypothetical protein
VETVPFDIAHERVALGSSDAVADRGLHRPECVLGQREDRTPHRQVLDQCAVDLERPADVRDLDIVDPGMTGQEDRGRVGRVEGDHAVRSGHHIRCAMLRRDVVPAGQARPSLASVIFRTAPVPVAAMFRTLEGVGVDGHDHDLVTEAARFCPLRFIRAAGFIRAVERVVDRAPKCRAASHDLA